MRPRRVLHRSPVLYFLACLAATPALATNHVRSYLVDGVTLPVTASQVTAYAIDLDGDAHADNQFGQVLSALNSQGLDLQVSMSAAVASGSVVHLLGLQSTDAFFANDPAAQADWYVGLPTPAPPLFDGTDTPAINNAIAPGTFLAALSSGSFTSPAPATTTTPVSLTFDLVFGPSAVAQLTLLGSRLTFTTDNAGHMQGQINGSIPQDDVTNKLEPAFALDMNSIIQSDPNSSTATAIKSLFDKGCAGQNGLANNGLIEICEVAENPLMQTLLAPDMQLDANSHYVLSGGTTLALSFGFRFTAVADDRVFANGFESSP